MLKTLKDVCASVQKGDTYWYHLNDFPNVAVVNFGRLLALEQKAMELYRLKESICKICRTVNCDRPLHRKF